MGIWQRLRGGRAEEEAVDCVVVGAGLSGLAIAKACIDQQSNTVRRYGLPLIIRSPTIVCHMRLNVSCFSLIVTEADTRPGGVIRSSSTAEGFLWEEGPNSFQPTPAMLKAAVRSVKPYRWCMCSCRDARVWRLDCDTKPAHAAFCARMLQLRHTASLSALDRRGTALHARQQAARLVHSVHSCVVAQAECGLEKDLLFADAKAPRFVLWGNKLRPVPASPLTLLKTDLLSTRGKARAVFGALGLKARAPGAASCCPWGSSGISRLVVKTEVALPAACCPAVALASPLHWRAAELERH